MGEATKGDKDKRPLKGEAAARNEWRGADAEGNIAPAGEGDDASPAAGDDDRRQAPRVIAPPD